MQHLNVRFDLDEKTKEARDQRIALLKADAKIQAFLKDNHLDESEIERHSGLYARYVKSRETCAACAGLSFCAMKIKGRQMSLQADEQGFVDLVYTPCAYQSSESRRLAHKKNYTLSHLSDADYGINIHDLAKNMEHETPNYMQAYLKAIASLNDPAGLFLFGPSGTGKTTMLAGLANEYARKGLRVVFVRVPTLIAQLKSNLGDSSYREQTLARMRHADVLFLDDIGSEMATIWSRDEILFPILDERMNTGRKTYFASNVPADGVIERYIMERESFGNIGAQRLAERIFTLARPVELLGKSRRAPQGSSLSASRGSALSASGLQGRGGRAPGSKQK